MTLSRAVYQDWRDYLANRDQKNGKPKKMGCRNGGLIIINFSTVGATIICEAK